MRVLKGLLTQRFKRQAVVSILLLVLMCLSGGMGSVFGFFLGTGELPGFLAGGLPVVILPNVTENTTTLVDIGHFLERDKTDEIEYGEGFNCVEYTILAARNAHWEGLPTEVGGIVYTDGSKHMILIFPTKEGYVFADPQLDEVINIWPGKVFNYRVIGRIEILTYKWEVLMQ